MDLDQLVGQHATLIAAVGGLRGDTLSETALRIFLVGSILRSYGPGDILDGDALMTLAAKAELELPVNGERLLVSAEATGIVVRVGSHQLEVVSDIGLDRVFADANKRRGSRNVPLAAYREAITGVGQKASTVGTMPDLDQCIAAIQRAQAWTAETIRVSLDRAYEGIPCLWQCGAGAHTPSFPLPGTSTTMVQVWTWLRSMKFAPHEPADSDLLSAVAELLLGLQRSDFGWESGAFTVSGNDDDFTGSFEESVDAESGACPTVDSTAGGVDILATLLATPHHSRALSQQLHRRIEAGVERGVDFLLRTQLDGGAWGIYRYESDAHEVVPREVSSAIAVQALVSVIKTSSVATTVDRVRDALERYLNWLEIRLVRANDRVWWLPDFTARTADERDRQTATTWVSRSLLALVSVSVNDEIAGRADRLLQSALAFIATWDVDRAAAAAVQFRVPRRHQGLSPTSISWNLPRDALISATLLENALLAGEPCRAEQWASVSASVGDVLSTELHGHWAHYGQRRQGLSYASPGSTKYSIELLISFVEYLAARTRAIPALVA